MDREHGDLEGHPCNFSTTWVSPSEEEGGPPSFALNVSVLVEWGFVNKNEIFR